MRSTSLLPVTLRQRAPARLDTSLDEAGDPPVDALVAAAAENPAGALWICGGEPTLRRDLPALLRALGGAGALGLISDAQALASPGAAKALRDAGLQRVRVQLHSIRSDAHDWLMNQPKAAARARRALQVCQAAGLGVEAEVAVTRPTTPHLAETVAALARLGAKRVTLRRPLLRGVFGEHFASLSPRLGLAEPHLEAALEAAEGARILLQIVGFPACALGAARGAAAPPPAWIGPLADHFAPPAPAPGCATCPGDGRCPGAPADYVARFDRGELASEYPARRAPVPIAAEGATPRPPARGGRDPATRLRFVQRQLGLPRLSGDPMAGLAPPAPPETLRIHLSPDVPSRELRRRMARAAQQGARTLRLTGAFGRDDWLELARDALRLKAAGGFQAVELSGEGRALAALDARQRLQLRGLDQICLALLGPTPALHDTAAGEGAWAAAIEGASALAAARSACGAVRPGALADWGDASASLAEAGFALTLLPAPGAEGAPALASLAAEAADAPAPLRAAIEPGLPTCLSPRGAAVAPAGPQSEDFDRPGRPPAVPDRRGAFSPCPEAPRCLETPRCPGLAAGWRPDGIAPIGA